MTQGDISMIRWLTLLTLSCLAYVNFGATADLSKIANFRNLHAHKTTLSSDASLLSISQFIEEVFDLPSQEKYLACSSYMQNNNLNTAQFINLIQALLVAKINDEHADALIGLFAASKSSKFSKDNFQTLMNLFSDDAFNAVNEGANWPFQFLSQYLEYRFLDLEEIKYFAGHFKRLGIPTMMIDQKLLPKYIQLRGRRLEPGDVEELLKSLERDATSVKSAADIIALYVRVNASRLTQPEFRESLEFLRRKAPYTIGADTGENLSEGALNTLYWAEFEYFKPWWKRENIITTISSLITEWETIAGDESAGIAKAFVQRNQHRLKTKVMRKIQDHFQI